MASTTEVSSSTTATPIGPASPQRRGNRGRGGFGRGRGSGQGASSNNSRGRGGQRGAHGGRGGGGRDGVGVRRGQDSNSQDSEALTAIKAPPPASQQLPKEGEETEDVEADICFICASPVVHQSVAPCNHRTCHICSLRLRALYKTKACAHCRTQQDFVIFTDDPEKRYEDFSDSDFSSTNDNLGIHFEKTEIFEDTVLLLRYNCPDADCDVACLGWPDLHRHVRTAHQKVMCDLCTRNKKVFTHEHELFTQADLRKHQKFGDDNPGAVDQSGFKGHPECGFCRQRFYGDDELYTHCRDKHERCHLCDRRNEGRKQQYYADYNALEVHFRKDHFTCPDQECLEQKFVVFDSEMDLKAHQLEKHPNGLSKDARRDARRVDMSGFQFRAPHEQQPERRREGRGRGRGRDPNAEPLPPSSAQPLRRDELAYQRQMAMQNAQSSTGRAFGGQLTSTDTFAAAAPASAQEPATVTAARPSAPTTQNVTNQMNSLGLDSTEPPRDLTPQEQARRLRHNAVTERAANLLRNDQAKLAEFRTKVSSYKNSTISATELIEGFFSLFDTSSAELGKLIKELADIFEIPSKRDNLLKAWNDWKAINEDYPSLPGNPGLSSGNSSTGHGGSRVLKLKSSTAQSSRSAVNKQGSWGTASGNSNPFPPLAAAASSNRNIGARPGQTPWATGSASTSARASPAPSRVASQTALNNNRAVNKAEAFPALPAAAKPTSSLFSPGYSGAGIRRDNRTGNSGPNAWGGGSGVGANPGSSSAENAADDVFGAGGQKGKGKKNKKQTLFHFG